MSQTVSTATNTSTRSPHPLHPARTALAQDSGTIVTTAGPGKGTQKLINGAQRGATKEGEVFSDFF